MGDSIIENSNNSASEDTDLYIEIKLNNCPYFANDKVCDYMNRFATVRNSEVSLSKIEVATEVLRFPVSCPLATFYKCRYLKNYYYKVVPYARYSLSSLDNNAVVMLEEDEPVLEYYKLPDDIRAILLAKYMDMPKGEHDFVIESHILTANYIEGDKKIPKTGSQHLDFRIDYGDRLEGWTITGGSVDDMISPSDWLTHRGFRAEEKAIQDRGWLFKDKKPVGTRIDALKVGDTVPEMFDVIVGEGEPRGKMFVVTRGKLIFGVQKTSMHEYFIKDNEFFKDWTRIMFRAIEVSKIDPETGEKTKHKEIMWRFLLPEDQCPYAISNRAIKKEYKPPKSNPEPFPKDFVLKNFKEQYEKWKNWISGNSDNNDKDKDVSNASNRLAQSRFAYKLHYWKGQTVVRNLYNKEYFLFINNGSETRMFRSIDDLRTGDEVFFAYDGVVNPKYMDMEGKTEPNSFFNANKRIEGTLVDLAKGSCDLEITKDENGAEIITAKLKSDDLNNKTLVMHQEDKSSDYYLCVLK